MSSEETKEQEENTQPEEEQAEAPPEEDSEERQTMSLEDLAEMLAAAAKEEENNEPSLENMRSIGLYGDVEEERVSEVIAGLLTLHYMGKPKITEEGEVKEEGKPQVSRDEANTKS